MTSMLFIFGSPRSGTSWISKIIDSHPGIVFRHEPDSVRRNTNIPAFCDPSDFATYQKEAEAYLHYLLTVRTSKVVGSLPVFQKSYQSPLIRELRRGLIVGAKAGERITPLRNFFMNLPIPDFLGQPVSQPFALKSIDALGRAGLFMNAEPNAKAIHVIRHPCGHIASVLRGIQGGKFDTDVPITEDMGVYEDLALLTEAKDHNLDITAFKNMKPLERLAWRWALSNEKAMNDLAQTKLAYTLVYETFCEEPEDEAKRLFDFAGLSWNEQTAQFLAASTTGKGDEAFYQIFRDPKKAAYKWKEELRDSDIETIMNVALKTAPGALFEPSSNAA